MGSQTDAIRTQLCRDAYTEPMSGLEQASSMFQSTSCNASTQTTPSPSKDALRPQLSNSEERSIHELFQVARRTNPEESKRDFLDGHRSGGLTTSKGFESRAASVCEVGKASSIPTALDAMEKMVSEGSLSSGEGVIGSSFSSISSQQHNTNTTSSAHPSTRAASNSRAIDDDKHSGVHSFSLAGNSHTSAGSPVFSDISDDAPTLEKEVVDKTEDRCSERMKLVASTRSPVVSLSLPVNSDKVRSDASAVSTTASNTVDLQSVPSSSLSANLLPSSKNASTNQSSIRPINDSITSTNHIPTLSTDSRREMKPICVSSSSATTTPLISFSPAIPPFVGIDPATFTNAVRPAVGGVGVAGGSGGVSMMYNYNPNYMMQPFGISNPTSAVVSAALQSSSGGITTSSSVSTKHKIHDLKTVGAFTNAQGIGTELSKDSTKLSPSLLTSSDTRSPSTNTTNVAVASGLSNTSGNGLNLKNLSSASSSSQQQQQVNVATSSHAQTQTPPSRPVTFLLGQQQSSSVSLQSTPERTPNPTAALLQQQQQHQQQAHYLAQMQQQQQMQQYMSQMRFAGGFPMIPPTNPGMAHQAYEQALVAMQAGIAPANFGLFTPQSFQPK
ncbi:unnamed protein product [Anisakis simplex]|uniref:SAM domain-containing protein n=1 Tax=Anisakis simplex TaxID=6269 RepID=A0A158PMW7_ANISI|nr:unnamed protein product [Anisakis simplex]